MDTTHILEPAFHIVAAPAAAARPGMGSGGQAADMFPFSVAGRLKASALELLERMHLCSAPRILSARCLAGELPCADWQGHVQ